MFPRVLVETCASCSVCRAAHVSAIQGAPYHVLSPRASQQTKVFGVGMGRSGAVPTISDDD